MRRLLEYEAVTAERHLRPASPIAGFSSSSSRSAIEPRVVVGANRGGDGRPTRNASTSSVGMVFQDGMKL